MTLLPEQYRVYINAFDETLSALYRARRTIMEAFSEENPAVLPPKRQRTETQRRVERCPRCGGTLPKE